MGRLPRSIALAIALAQATSAALAAVTVLHDDGVDFSALRTYELREGTPARRSDVQKLIDDSVERELQDKGLRPAAGPPDVVVLTYALADRHTAEELEDPVYWEFLTGVTSVDAYDVEAGTLVIDLVDPATERVLWRGIASETVTAPAKKVKRRIDAVVRKMFKRFPPR